MYEAKRANSDDLISTYFVLTGNFKILFLMKAYYITSDAHIRKTGLIADVIAEIFKFKNHSNGNFVKYI